MPDADRRTSSGVFRRRLTACLLAMLPYVCIAPVFGAASASDPGADRYCEFTPPAKTGRTAPGLIVGAEVLLPEGRAPGHAVLIRFNGTIGAAGPFDVLRTARPGAAVLDCRGRAVLSPGFVNAHEHPAYSYAFHRHRHRPRSRLQHPGRRHLRVAACRSSSTESVVFLISRRSAVS